MFKFLVDNREHKVIEKILHEEFVELSCLPLGDFIIKKDDEVILVIERKSLNDLLSSINDGRYKEQKIRLLSNYSKEKILYIFEGKLKDCFKNNEKVNKMINGALVNTVLRDKITVIRTDSVTETSDILMNIFGKVRNNIEWFIKTDESKPELDYSSTIKVVKKENMTKEMCQIIQLSQIPGMSTTKAKAVLEKYGNIANLINEYNKLDEINEKEELLKNITINLRKLGKVLSKRIYEYII